MHFTPAGITLATLGFLASVNAHTVVTNIIVNGKDQGSQTGIRWNDSNRKQNASDPVVDISSSAMACGVGGGASVPKWIPVNAGDEMALQWHHLWNKKQEENFATIEQNHEGPCAVYMKKVKKADAAKDTAGDGWFKIEEVASSPNGDKNNWCTMKLENEDDGKQTFTVPKDLNPDDYLVRGEILALHNANKIGDRKNWKGEPGYFEPENGELDRAGAQFFINCAQLSVTGGTGGAEPETVAIPGYIDENTPGINYNIWEEPKLKKPFKMFGPPKYDGTKAANSGDAGEQSGGDNKAANNRDGDAGEQSSGNNKAADQGDEDAGKQSGGSNKITADKNGDAGKQSGGSNQAANNNNGDAGEQSSGNNKAANQGEGDAGKQSPGYKKRDSENSYNEDSDNKDCDDESKEEALDAVPTYSPITGKKLLRRAYRRNAD